MSRTRRLREAVLVLLEEKGTANTVEVFDHLNERFRWGANNEPSRKYPRQGSPLCKSRTPEGPIQR